MNIKIKSLFIELIVLFAGIPALLLVYQTPLLKLSILVAAVLITFFYLYKNGKSIKTYLNPGKININRYYILKVVTVCILIMVLGYFFRKENFFVLPYRPALIPLIIIFYPLISVIPQELIYRLFFYERYGILFKGRISAILVNAVLFSFMHTIYGNPFAVILTFWGGILLSNTYLKTNSLLLTVIEHSIYGYFVFLSGYGQYFLSENIFRFLLSQH